MSRLFLMRHAKASWSIPGVSDLERPLTRRGVSDAEEIARKLSSHGYVPDTLACSDAVRTMETWHHMSERIILDRQETHFFRSLYNGSTEIYLQHLQAVSNRSSVLMIGHNPTCEELANYLIADGKEKALRRLTKGFPTAGCAVIRFDLPLQKIATATGYLEAFLRPPKPEGSRKG